jgi:hypothetical protein
MRSISIALAALIGVVAANPVVEWPRNAPAPPYPTGVSSKPDETITYVTETICPVTYTHGTIVKTTLTTSTITVTSCKGGCHKPTPPPVYNPPGGDKTITKTYTTITYTFVPCSTSVGKNDHSVIYSTFLSQSAITKTYTTYEVVKPTPAPPAVTPIPEGPKPGTCVTTITQINDYFSCPPVAPPATVTETITITKGGPAPPPCHECVKTYTITEGGYETCITYTFEKPPTKPTETPKKPHYTPPVYTPPVHTPPVYTPPAGTGHSKPTPTSPKPTGGYTKGW